MERRVVGHFGRYAHRGVLVLAGVCGLFSLGLFLSAREDDRVLREQALQVTAGHGKLGDKIAALNSWVYRNQGFAKNANYFWWPKLGPTPRQIFEGGGDCADKSRLLSAMLDEIGIDSSLAMQYPCPDCQPVHTIVLAETEQGVTAVDPVYDIAFPDDEGGWHDVAALSRDEQVLRERLAELRRLRGAGDKIAKYDEETHHFRHATTLNWNKNDALRTVAGWLRGAGLMPQYMFRPRLMEDPKYALGTGFGAAAVPLAFLGGVMRVRRRRMRIRA